MNSFHHGILSMLLLSLLAISVNSQSECGCSCFEDVQVVSMVDFNDLPPIWEAGTTTGFSYDGDECTISAPSGGGSRTIQSRALATTEIGFLSARINLDDMTLPTSPGPYYWDYLGVTGRILQISGPHWYPAVALRVFRNENDELKGWLYWVTADNSWKWDYDNGDGVFDVPSGEFNVTIGYNTNSCIFIYINGILVRSRTNVTHYEPYGQRCVVGFNDVPAEIGGSFTVKYPTFYMKKFDDLYVSATYGSDLNNGTSANYAFKTIGRALNFAVPNTTVHIADGVYREQIVPPGSGLYDQPITLKGSGGSPTVVGSFNAGDLTWSLSPRYGSLNVLEAVVPGNYGFTKSPQFVVEVDSNTKVTHRYHIARTPNFQYDKVWRYTQYWYTADGGGSVAPCVPYQPNGTDNCDSATWSYNKLTHVGQHYADAGSTPPGGSTTNFKTVSDLTGATIVVTDGNSGHYIYKRKVTAHDAGNGIVTVDQNCEFDSGGAGALRVNSKFYVEDKDFMLDTEGEYFYDPATQKLYMWPRSGAVMSSIEISIPLSNRSTGIDLSGIDNYQVDGLNFKLLEHSGVRESGGYSYGSGSRNVTIQNCEIAYINSGIYIGRGVGDVQKRDTNRYWTIRYNVVHHADSRGLMHAYWKGATFTHAGLAKTLYYNNTFRDLSFNTEFYDDNRVGISLQRATDVAFIGNRFERIAHNGIQFSYSDTNSEGKIVSGNILFARNHIDMPCCSTADCGCIKFWSISESHVWKDVLVTENFCTNSMGYAEPSRLKMLWGDGYGGFGYYTDYVGGVFFYRNIAYNNANNGQTAYKEWEDSLNIYMNNVYAHGLYGFSLGGKNRPQTGQSIIQNNIIINTQSFGFTQYLDTDDYSAHQTKLDYNLYMDNGWDKDFRWNHGVITRTGTTAGNEYYEHLTDLPRDSGSALREWELHGYEELNPGFTAYNYSYDTDHWPQYLGEDPWIVFKNSGNTNITSKGSATIPEELKTLLDYFGVCNHKSGTNYDLGASFYDPSCVCCDADISFTWTNFTDDPSSSGNTNSAFRTSVGSVTFSLAISFIFVFIIHI